MNQFVFCYRRSGMGGRRKPYPERDSTGSRVCLPYIYRWTVARTLPGRRGKIVGLFLPVAASGNLNGSARGGREVLVGVQQLYDGRDGKRGKGIVGVGTELPRNGEERGCSDGCPCRFRGAKDGGDGFLLFLRDGQGVSISALTRGWHNHPKAETIYFSGPHDISLSKACFYHKITYFCIR